MDQLPPPNWEIPVNHAQVQPGFQTSYYPTVRDGQFPRFMPGALPGLYHYGQCRGPNNTPWNKQTYKLSLPPASKPVHAPVILSCDACCRDFNSQRSLDAHLALHEKCDQEGCDFKASRKALKLHFIQVHAEGRMRIKLDTPEEINKWRQERKRNYPTASNVAKRQAVMDEKQTNGQMLQTTSYSYRGNNRGRGGRGRWRRQNHGHIQSRTQVQPSSRQYKTLPKEQSSPHKMSHREPLKTPEGDPLDVLLDINGNKSEIATASMDLTESKGAAAGALPLSALGALCTYGDMSSDEEEDADCSETPKREITATPTPPPAPSQPKLTTQLPLKPSPQPLSQTVISLDTERKLTNGAANRTKQNTKSNRNPTLLEMLLAPEIRHERNAILQCLRYIVRNSFFET
ncbi:predicted protein [Nematostella vectensis]|uniref:C2H2-type domain-containing protein n=1 Tax=Nematostella vectensis TaxID=45351 RepID=A7SZM9_NEMVE|nr:predicted protein [Nematostella vectensis]|eukprot:XP_001622934.1 predicted protein [Nematostella vectensis]